MVPRLAKNAPTVPPHITHPTPSSPVSPHPGSHKPQLMRLGRPPSPAHPYPHTAPGSVGHSRGTAAHLHHLPAQNSTSDQSVRWVRQLRERRQHHLPREAAKEIGLGPLLRPAVAVVVHDGALPPQQLWVVVQTVEEAVRAPVLEQVGDEGALRHGDPTRPPGVRESHAQRHKECLQQEEGGKARCRSEGKGRGERTSAEPSGTERKARARAEDSTGESSTSKGVCGERGINFAFYLDGYARPPIVRTVLSVAFKVSMWYDLYLEHGRCHHGASNPHVLSTGLGTPGFSAATSAGAPPSRCRNDFPRTRRCRPMPS